MLYSVWGTSSGFLDKESKGAALVEQSKPWRMSNRVEHHINTLFLDEQLIDIKSGASRVTKTESGTNILLKDVPQCWVVVNTLGGDGEKFSLGTNLNLGVSDEPLLFWADFHQGELFNGVFLGIEDVDGSSCAVDS